MGLLRPAPEGHSGGSGQALAAPVAVTPSHMRPCVREGLRAEKPDGNACSKSCPSSADPSPGSCTDGKRSTLPVWAERPTDPPPSPR